MAAKFSHDPKGLFSFISGLSNFELLRERKKITKSKEVDKICLLAVKNGSWIKSRGLQEYVKKGKKLGLNPKDCDR